MAILPTLDRLRNTPAMGVKNILGDSTQSYTQNSPSILRQILAPIAAKSPINSISAMRGPGDNEEPRKPLSANEINEWNKFIGFVKEKGVAGSKDLDKRDKNRGLELFNEYKAKNPNTQITYDIVPRAQAEFQRVNKYISGLQERRGEKPKSQFNNISKEDGWFGSMTSQQELIPLEIQTKDDKGRVVQQVNAGLVNGIGVPTSMMKGGGSYGGAVLPKGAKTQRNADGKVLVQEYEGGDWTPIENYNK